jgi:hypothetical protein
MQYLLFLFGRMMQFGLLFPAAFNLTMAACMAKVTHGSIMAPFVAVEPSTRVAITSGMVFRAPTWQRQRAKRLFRQGDLEHGRSGLYETISILSLVCSQIHVNPQVFHCGFC